MREQPVPDGDPAPAEQPAEYDLRGALGLIERWCYGIARKAQVQGNEELAPTARIIGEEVARSLAGHDLAYAGVGDDPDMASLGTWLSIQRLNRANGLPPTDSDRTPLDRAARWGHELADVHAALVEWHGERTDDFIGQPTADDVRDALARERDGAYVAGELAAQDRVTPEVLARAAAYPNQPTESDVSAAREQHLRLALDLGWPP